MEVEPGELGDVCMDDETLKLLSPTVCTLTIGLQRHLLHGKHSRFKLGLFCWAGPQAAAVIASQDIQSIQHGLLTSHTFCRCIVS